MQIKYALPARDNRREGSMALSMGRQLGIEFGFELIFHHAGFCDSHQPSNSCLGDLHRFADGSDFLRRLDLSHIGEQWITIPDREMRMPLPHMSGEFALDIIRM